MNGFGTRPSVLSHQHATCILVLAASGVDKTSQTFFLGQVSSLLCPWVNEQALDAVGNFSGKALRPWKDVRFLGPYQKIKQARIFAFFCFNSFGTVVDGNSRVCNKKCSWLAQGHIWPARMRERRDSFSRGEGLWAGMFVNAIRETLAE